jgi:hypothetical protein
MLARAIVAGGPAMSRSVQPGDILASGEVYQALAGDVNSTITAALIAAGLINRTGMTAGRTDTTDTADAVLKAMGGNDYQVNIVPGSAFRFSYRQAAAFATTWAHGRGWIAGIGTLDVPASNIRDYLCRILNSTPEVALTGATTNANAVVTLAVPQAPGVITPGMLVSAAAGITAGTKVAGVQYGDSTNRINMDKIVAITLDQNATATNAANALTFSPVIEISTTGTKAI